ncbi:iron complex transport system substrate-binding protein/vitamin B12 transport system substrate-binding protein [Paludibacterium purpuratum]|uniref:Iron complex transport system substrate-binding protein/vitamin B12 transport system substrate-binding protein n=2 Tax=Paludibacterium purpuratum TaxID=1144873 RepID=A0A4R7B9M4_9NEIS|nr:iron complex transport system substrate-binding protein/vitamin B12 transport system substrate-binding protein [Paludibacterium purpuratum]
MQIVLQRLAVLLFLCVGLAAHAQVTARDGTGAPVTLAQPAQRIITLAPSATELAYAAGAGARMVGTVAFSDYPPAAKRLPRVGDLMGVSLEAILRLRPDLVVVWKDGTAPQLLQRLRDAQVAVFVSHPLALDDVAGELLALGKLSGTEPVASRAAAAYRQKIADLRTRYHGRPQVSVFYQMSQAPLFTVSDASYIGAVLQLCGGRNLFGALAAPAPQVGREAVVAGKPQVMLAASTQELAIWDSWKAIPAVAHGTRYAIDVDLASRPGPRLAEGAEAICATLDRARRVLGLTPR